MTDSSSSKTIHRALNKKSILRPSQSKTYRLRTASLRERSKDLEKGRPSRDLACHPLYTRPTCSRRPGASLSLSLKNPYCSLTSFGLSFSVYREREMRDFSNAASTLQCVNVIKQNYLASKGEDVVFSLFSSGILVEYSQYVNERTDRWWLIMFYIVGKNKRATRWSSASYVRVCSCVLLEIAQVCFALCYIWVMWLMGFASICFITRWTCVFIYLFV